MFTTSTLKFELFLILNGAGYQSKVEKLKSFANGKGRTGPSTLFKWPRKYYIKGKADEL